MEMPGSPDPDGRDQAILDPAKANMLDVRRRHCQPSLSSFVDYYWIVRWRTDQPHIQRVIPQPIVHVAGERGRMLVHGVGDNEFSRTLTGTGHVLGIAFRPGGFHAVIDRPVSAVTRSVLPLGDVTDIDDEPVATRIADPSITDDEMVATADGWLTSLALQPDPVIDHVADLVYRAETDQAITRVDDLAEVAGVGVRSLQRLFGEYVGIGPKWVIQRFRLLDVAAVANRGGVVDWAAAANDLGFSDQAHMIRAFTQVVGTPPATYARSVSAEPSATASAQDQQQDQ